MDYTVVHSGRRTIAIQIQRDGRVVVRAPYAATAENIRRVVDSHRDWVEKTVRRQQEQRQEKAPLAHGPHDGRSCVTLAPAGTSSVIQTLPPMTAPRPTVTRPRMVAPA